MNGFLKSFTPLLKKSKKYLVEIILLTTALIITISALAIYAKNNHASGSEEVFINSQIDPSPAVSSGEIFVDVSGSVKKPSVYKISFGARLKDLIDKAGGLSDEADRLFFDRNFNLARIVSDQEKLYVPSITEINQGIFIQNQRILDYISPVLTSSEITQSESTKIDLGLSDNEIININSGTLEELDQLPGVGEITANKIIANRPYSTTEELLSKKIVNKSVYEKIKKLISN